MSASEKEYAIYVKTLAGSNKEVRVKSDFDVKALKKKVEDALSCKVLKLLFRHKELSDDSKTLSDLKIEQESIVIAIIETEKPSHYFFALDESGSMSGNRWGALVESFKEFVDKQQKLIESASQGDVAIQDVVTVFYHETGCRLAQCRLPDGSVVPFESIPMTELRGDSLATNPSLGGNDFDHALTIMEPYLMKCTAYVPVLLFMTDGGDCGDNGPGGDYRQRSYDHMAKIKRDIPDLRVYVTIVFSTDRTDIEGAKRLCKAAGMDVDTHYSSIEDDGSLHSAPPSYAEASYGCAEIAYLEDSVDMSFEREKSGGFLSSLGKMWDDLWAPSPSSSSSSAREAEMECDEASAPRVLPASLSSSSSSAAAAASHYSGVSEKSAQRKMASHWDSVYTANSLQSECYQKISK